MDIMEALSALGISEKDLEDGDSISIHYSSSETPPAEEGEGKPSPEGDAEGEENAGSGNQS